MKNSRSTIAKSRRKYRPNRNKRARRVIEIVPTFLAFIWYQLGTQSLVQKLQATFNVKNLGRGKIRLSCLNFVFYLADFDGLRFINELLK